MSSEDGPQAAAAAGPTNGGDGATPPCNYPKCIVLERNLKEAREDQMKINIDNLMSEAKDVSKLSAERLCLEDAIRMYLAAQLTQLPEDVKVKFSLWMRDDKKLTPREQKNYQQVVNTTRIELAKKVDPKLQASYKNGMFFLKDVARGDYAFKEDPLQSAEDDKVVSNLHTAINNVQNGLGKVCNKRVCGGSLFAALDLQKKYKEYRCAVFNKQKHINEVEALRYALTLIKIVYSKDNQTKEVAQKPRNAAKKLLNTQIRRPNKIYKRAVNLVRRLQWRGGLPSAEIGRAFHDAVESAVNMTKPKPDQCRTLKEERRLLTVYRGIMNAAFKKNELNNLEQKNKEPFDSTKIASVKDQLDWVDEEVQILEKMMEEEQNGSSEEELEKWRQEEKEIEKKFTERAEKMKKEFLQGYDDAVLSVLQNEQQPIISCDFPTDTTPATLYKVPDCVQRGVIDQIMRGHIFNFLLRMDDLRGEYLDPTQQEGQQPIDETLALDQTSNVSPSTVSSAPNASRKRRDGSGGSTIPSKTRKNDD